MIAVAKARTMRSRAQLLPFIARSLSQPSYLSGKCSRILAQYGTLTKGWERDNCPAGFESRLYDHYSAINLRITLGSQFSPSKEAR